MEKSIQMLGVLDVFIGFVNIFLAIMVLVKTRGRQKIHVAAGILALSLAAYCFIDGARLICAGNTEAFLFWTRMTWATGFIVATLVLSSEYVFDKKITASTAAVMYLPALFFTVLAHTEYGVRKIISVNPRVVDENGVSVSLFALWIIVCLAYALRNFIVNYRYTTMTKRLQVHYYALSFIIAASLGVFSGIVMPELGRIEYKDFVPFFLLAWTVGATYAVVKEEKLLGIRILVYEMIKFGSMLLFFVSLNYAALYILSETAGLGMYVSSTISLLIIGLLCFALPWRQRFNEAVKGVVLSKRMKYHKLLNDCSRALVSILDIDELLDYVINSMHAALGNSKIGIFMKENNRFRLVASLGLKNVSVNFLENAQLLKFLESGKMPFLLDTAWNKFSDHEYEKLVKELGVFGAVLVMPLISKGNLVGVLTLDQKRADGSIFDIDDIETLQSLAYELAVAMENARLYSEIEETHMDITRALSIAVEEKEGYTLGHSDNVTKFSMAIAQQVNMQKPEITDLVQASVLHDIGKIGIHESILLKPGKLDDREWEEMRKHSEKGAKILAPLHIPKVSEIVIHHHERYDGKGYPEGLKADQIPLGAQILSIADSFDAMLTERPYRTTPRKSFTVEEAIEELERNRGTQFNPRLVDAFVKVLRENPNLARKNVIAIEADRGKSN